MRARRVVAACAVAGLVALVIWAGYAVTELPVFAIDRVQVQGSRHLSTQEVLDLAAIPRGDSLLRLPKRRIASRLLQSPWVEDVRIDRDLPRTVKIELSERTPVVVVDDGGAEFWVVSDDALWLGPRSATETDLPVVRDAEVTKRRTGARVSSPEIANAVALVQGVSSELLRQTRFISAPAVERTALVTDDDVEVFFGEAVDVATKDRIAREILRREKGKVVYINVRVVESPTWRGLEP